MTYVLKGINAHNIAVGNSITTLFVDNYYKLKDYEPKQSMTNIYYPFK